MRIARPRFRCRGRRCYWVIEERVDYDDTFVILSLDEWRKILMLYDAFLVALALAEKYVGKAWVSKVLDIERRKGAIAEIERRIREGEDAIKALVIERELLEKDMEELASIERDMKAISKWVDSEWKLIALQDEELSSSLRSII